jgi:transcription initiation factor TFIIIB Brf1 subunit/transcription initiation factor TFIIB
VCVECGLVCRQRTMARDFDVRVFEDSAAEQRRTGVPEDPYTPAMHGMATFIAGPTATQSQACSAATTAGRLCAAQLRASNDAGGSDARAHAVGRQVEAICTALELPTALTEAAKQLVARFDAAARKMRRADSAAAAAAAAVMIACEVAGAPRTLKEIAAGAAATGGAISKQIVAAKKAIQVALKLCPPPAAPAALVPRFCAGAGVGPSVERRAREIAGLAAFSSLGLAPASVAAAAILVAAREAGAVPRPSAGEIARASGAAESTVMKVARKVGQALHGRAVRARCAGGA